MYAELSVVKFCIQSGWTEPLRIPLWGFNLRALSHRSFKYCWKFCSLNWNYPIIKICWPKIIIILKHKHTESEFVIWNCSIKSCMWFGKVLYLIPEKMPPKRYGGFREHHTYITLTDYQTASSLSPACLPVAEPPSLEKRKGS